MIQVSLEESTPFCLFSTNHHQNPRCFIILIGLIPWINNRLAALQLQTQTFFPPFKNKNYLPGHSCVSTKPRSSTKINALNA